MAGNSRTRWLQYPLQRHRLDGHRMRRDMGVLCLRIMEDAASGAEQQAYAQRLIAAGERLRRRGNETFEMVEATGIVIDGKMLRNELVGLHERTAVMNDEEVEQLAQLIWEARRARR